MKRGRRGNDGGPSLFAPEPDADAAFAPRVHAGIDEAGYGPLLGPLTIGACALRHAGDASLPWRALAPLVGRGTERDPARLAVGDSKAVFERNARGRARLERTVLAFHAQLHTLPADARAFLAATPPPLGCAELADEAWYTRLGARLAEEPAPMEPSAEQLRARLAAAGIEVVLTAVRAIPVPTLNTSFERTRSKGATHWEQCSTFLAALWERFALEGLEIWIDRHGGRKHYAEPLAATFPAATIRVIHEATARSVYMLSDDAGRRARLVFSERAEDSSFAVALASCQAKYARELCMEAFNAHFLALQPGLAPTAGYVTDARRWLADAEPALARSGIRPGELLRSR